MDELLIALQHVSEQLLPILGAVALIFLCILLKKLWALIEKLTATVGSLDPTIKLVDQSIEKAQAPLDTAVKLSHTIDDVHEKTVDSISKAATVVSDNIDNIKDYIQDKMDAQEGEHIVLDTYEEEEKEDE